MNNSETACLGPPVLVSPAQAAEHVKTGLWGHLSLTSIFMRHVDAKSDALALSDGPPLSDGIENPHRQLTYGEADLAVRLIAARLSSCGLTPGDIVALQLPPQIEAPVTMLACLGLGYVVCPIPFSWRRLEIEPAIARVGARAIVTWSDGPHCERVAAACEAAFLTPSIRFVFAFGDDVPDGVTPLSPALEDPEGEMVPRMDFPLSVDPNALAVITWDASSTTNPRAVARSHNECIAAATPAVIAATLCQRATILTPYTLSTLAGLAGAFIPWLMTGGLLVMHRPFDPEVWSEQVSVYEPDLILVPDSLAPALALPGGPASGGWNPVIATVRQPSGNNPPFEPSSSDCRPVDIMCLGESAMIARPYGDPTLSGAGSIPLGRVTVGGDDGPVLIETSLAATDDDAPCEIMVRGAQAPSAVLTNNGDGHRFRPAGDVDGFVATGIFARPGDKPEIANIATAPDGVVRYGSSSISLTELDELYASFGDVADAAALAVADPTMGARLLAAVVPRDGETADLAGMIEHLGQLGVARYKLPDGIVSVSAIPRDGDGAIERGAITAKL